MSTLLDYASPQVTSPAAAEAVQFHVGLPPMDAWSRAAMLGPYGVLPLVLLVGLATLFYALELNFDPRMGWVVAFVVVADAAIMTRVARPRGGERIVGATSEHVYYSDGLSPGRPANLVRAESVDIGVRPNWWRPWVYELVAAPKTGGSPARARDAAVPLDPVVLLSDLDRGVVERIAAGLVRSTATSSGINRRAQ